MAQRSRKKRRPPARKRTRTEENPRPAPAVFFGGDVPAWVGAAIIAVACLAVFWPALNGTWLWDDNFYIHGNFFLRDPARLWKIWFAPGSFVEYYPIEQTVQWLQWRLWGEDTLGYHLTNLGLHIVNALLVWRLLLKFGLRFAWWGGLIFAVHPVVVESVAWMSELKNTLSLLPFLLALGALIDYEESGRRRDYLLALGLFLLAMLCKISMAPFPLVILLYAWWKRGRIGPRDLADSAPFFVISVVLGLTTMHAGVAFRQLAGMATDSVPIGGFFSRAACAGLALMFYLGKCLWPVDLMPIYPKWDVDPPALWQFWPWPIFAGLAAACWLTRRGWGRHVALGFGFFAVHLAPFLGFTAISYMGFSWVMDHLLYLPLVGIIGLAVAALDRLAAWLPAPARPCIPGVLAVVAAILAWGSHAYAEDYTDEKALWSYTVERNPAAWMAHNNLGNVLAAKGDIAGAMAQYQAAAQVNPGYADPHNNMGNLYQEMNKLPEAIAQYEQALDINFTYVQAHVNLGNALYRAGRAAEARRQYEEALQLDPKSTQACIALGNLECETGHFPEAAAQYQEALRMNPYLDDAHNDLGAALAQMGRKEEAAREFQTALRINAANASAQQNLESLPNLKPGAAVKIR